jgi:hypothetical protein
MTQDSTLAKKHCKEGFERCGAWWLNFFDVDNDWLDRLQRS